MRIFQTCEAAIRAWVMPLQSGKASEPRTISIFEKLRAQATSSKFQTPSSKEAPISKLKNRPARCLPRHLYLEFGVLRFGTSLELGVWCLVFRVAVAQKLGCGAPQALVKTELSNTRSRVTVAAL